MECYVKHPRVSTRGMYVCMHVCIYVYGCMHLCTYVSVYLCVCICMCMCMCMCVFLLLFIDGRMGRDAFKRNVMQCNIMQELCVEFAMLVPRKCTEQSLCNGQYVN